jgi:hypothetical protein
MDVSVARINELVRPYYPDSTYKYPDRRIDTLFGDSSPFWYRGFYSGDKTANLLKVDSALQKFNINRIVTGHTIVADSISVWYNGKVINTDTHHAKGHSEALLIEGGNFYRVDGKGHRALILKKE